MAKFGVKEVKEVTIIDQNTGKVILITDDKFPIIAVPSIKDLRKVGEVKTYLKANL